VRRKAAGGAGKRRTKVSMSHKKPAKVACRNGLTAKEREEFRDILLKRRDEITGNVEHLETKALNRGRRDAAGDISAVPTHMADVASDNYDQEVTFGLIQNEREELKAINAALKRIDDNTYGLCEVCEKPIPKARLRALPYARLCIQCKKEQEEGRGVAAPAP